MTNLTALDRDLWVGHHPHKLFGLFPLGHWMTVVRQPDGGLTLISPIPWSESLAAELEQLGPVRHVLAPNLMHNLFLDRYEEAFPESQFWAVPGFKARYPKLRVDAELSEGSKIVDLQFTSIDGMPKLNEFVVLHEPTKSLIVADLVFNFPATKSLALRGLLWSVGGLGKLTACRLFKSMIKDRAATRASVDRVLDLDFDRLIVGHGEALPTGAKAALTNSYGWLKA